MEIPFQDTAQKQGMQQNKQHADAKDAKKANQRAYAASGPDAAPAGTPGAIRDSTLQSFATTFHKGGVVSAPERSSEYRKVYLKRKGK